MRADVNLSVRKKGEALGTRTEMKNLSSFRAISRAIESEKRRQVKIIEDGGTVIMETRRYDEQKDSSYAMRSKEDEKDYRYFPEPDLAEIFIDDDMVNQIREGLPELRDLKMARYRKEYGLPEYDSCVLTGNKYFADIFERTVAISNKPKQVSNWIMGETMRLLNERSLEPENIMFSPENLAKLIELTDKGVINSNTAKEVFEKIFDDDIDPDIYIRENNLVMESDEEELKRIVAKVVEENSQSVNDYRNGKEKALGYLVGQTMKATKGKANPGIINKLLREIL